MEQNELRQIVKRHFFIKFGNKYGLEYELKEITDIKDVKHINFVIYGNSGVVADFWVSENGIFEALIKGDMARSTYEIECWHDFMKDLEQELRELWGEIK